MFIYHFSRLIKSKLLWGFLALLMVFAFVVMDSCSSSGAEGSVAGYLEGESVNPKLLSDASQTVTVLNGQSAYYLPRASQAFSAIVRGDEADDWQARRRQAWKIIAAANAAQRTGITGGQAAAYQVLESAFVGPDGAFNPNLYRFFLNANNYAKPKLFEETFANAWLPAQTAALAVFNATGWVSPMEQDFALAATYDKTTAYAATLKTAVDPATITVAEADIAAWYEAHKEDYRLPEQRVVESFDVPLKAFADKLTIEEMDAMQYYDDHSEEFRGTGTNATKTLPFEEVKDKAIAKVRDIRALEEALIFANENLVPKAQVSGIAEAAKGYEGQKTATLRKDATPAYQNGGEFLSAVFEMDPEETPCNAVAGNDRVYVVRLQRIIETHIPALADVKARVEADVRADRVAQRIKEQGEALRGLLAGKLTEGTAFDAAVAACATEGLTATTAMTFVLNDSAKVDIAHRNEVLDAASMLGPKGLSKPIIAGDEILLVYVSERTPGDDLAKVTAKQRIAQSLGFGAAFQTATDWMNWNLDRAAPTSDASGDIPLLTGDAAEEE